MKNNLLKKVLSIAVCLSLIGMVGCSGDTNVDPDSDSASNSQNVSSDTEQTEATQTTTTTTTTTTEKSDESSSSSSEKSTSSTSKTTDPNAKKYIALTFDDGPYSPVTNRILDTLEKHGAKATFFVVGDRVAQYATSLKRASDLGCEIGSHTYSHKNLNRLSVSEMSNEMSKSVDAISRVTGKGVAIMRPPEGAANDTVKNNVGFPLIMWSVDSLDWKNRNMQMNYNNVVDDVFDGSIILMHDLYPATADAVERIVPDLIAKGYVFVTVSELMRIRGVALESGVKYSSAKP